MCREALVDTYIQDGSPCHILYRQNLLGEVTRRDTTGVTNAPHARYWYFAGEQMGDVSNDGTSNVDYVTAIASHRTVPGSGFFQNGKTTGTKYSDLKERGQS